MFMAEYRHVFPPIIEEEYENCRTADDLEYLHDVRLVRTSEIQGSILVEGRSYQLAYRIF